MLLIRQGFDGLDVSFQAQISHSFVEALDLAKTNAQRFQQAQFLEWQGVPLLVKESGARGGYAFTVISQQPSAVWFFKKPNPRDPWGVRVSCKSLQLALKGAERTWLELTEMMRDLRIIHTGPEAISRVDYALDFLAPAFVLTPSRFVMHSNTSRMDYRDGLDVRTHGNSGRVTSVTVGKMPGKQVIIYDKRQEIIARRKSEWCVIWNDALLARNLPTLDLRQPELSRVWRLELRAGKQWLRKRWQIGRWSSLQRYVGNILTDMLDQIRYCAPNEDKNRSRWPAHDLWNQARSAVRGELMNLNCQTRPEDIKTVQREQYDELLVSQIRGLLVSRAALWGKEITELPDFAARTGRQVAEDFDAEPSKFMSRLEKATGRLRVQI